MPMDKAAATTATIKLTSWSLASKPQTESCKIQQVTMVWLERGNELPNYEVRIASTQFREDTLKQNSTSNVGKKLHI
jgi:hypothetical protein